ncbi:MAG TPA: hypothetical protein VFR37_01820, partial [Longimicrobium sp.]|nr:hypothetical protein [Longimicrobium sp.]
MGKLRLLAAALISAAALSACSDEPTTPDAAPAPQTPPAAQLDVYFEEAGRDYGIPASLLKSIGYV